MGLKNLLFTAAAMAPAALAQSGAWGQCKPGAKIIMLESILTSLRWWHRLDWSNCKNVVLSRVILAQDENEQQLILR